MAPTILFDGMCGLCGAMIAAVSRADRTGRFELLPLQSEQGAALARRFGIGSADLLESIVLIENDQAYRRSTALTKIAGQLHGWWRVVALARFIPRPVRDLVYRFVAANRYRIFGKNETCYVPERNRSR